MLKRLLVSMALVLAAGPALPQTDSAPIQTAQADEKPATAEQTVVLPESAIPSGLLIGVGVAVGLAILSMTVAVQCDDSSGGGCGPATPTTTATR